MTSPLLKIIVTGGAGFIGSHTVVELAQAGFEPVILDNFSNSKPFIVDNIRKITRRDIHLYQVDCADAAAVMDVFEKEKDVFGIIHFAAVKAVEESVKDPLYYYSVNLMSLIAMLSAAQVFQVPHFVFSSSCTVYGNPDHLPVTEEAPLKPAISPYGNTKKIAEEIICDAVKSGFGLKAVALRYFNTVGAHISAMIGELPQGTPRNLVPFITQTAAGLREKLMVYGCDYATVDGSCVRDYIHVVDLARAHVRSLNYLASRPENNFYDFFNIGTGHGHSVLELIRVFERVNGVKLAYDIGPRRRGDIAIIYGGVEKANRLLGWKSELSIEDSLRSAWAWQVQLPGNGL